MLEDRHKTINNNFVLLLALGIMARFFVMEFGHNFDFESYLIVGDIVRQGGNVYAETTRYNYGFLFFLIQGFGYTFASHFPDALQGLYRAYIVSVLTAADIGIALIIAKKYSYKGALLFFLNPMIIIITGYHNQFDNIAILFALIAMLFVDENDSFSVRDYLSIAFLSLSLITKHIMCFFFLWLLMNETFVNVRKKIAYSFLPPVVFLISFIPWIMGNTEALNGVINNVFLYRSYNNYPLLSAFLTRLGISNSYYFYIFIALIATVGVLSRTMKMEGCLLLYLVSLVAFSSAIANQYLIIPIATLAIYQRKIFYWIYTILGSIYCILNSKELHLADRFAKHFSGISDLIIRYAEEGGIAVTLLTYVLVLFIVTFIVDWYSIRKREETINYYN